MEEEADKVFIWIFDHRDFTIKDMIEIADYEINIDEETNANSMIKVLKETIAKAEDIVAIKKNNKIIYWGIIDNIQNEDGKQLYKYSLKYITNMFNQSVPASKNTEKNEIEEGYYRIKSAVDPKKVLDVNHGSMENEANVQIWGNGNTSNQKWKITKNSDGSFEIRCLKSNKVLDVPAQNYADRTSIQQYEAHGGDSQKFNIQHLQGAYYKIKTKASNFYLDVKESKTQEGTDVIIYHATDNLNQKFIFEKLDEEIIKDIGIEDYIAKTINDNFIKSKDQLLNKNYLEVRVKTHTRLQTSISNVSEQTYNLHTWMVNCTQLYNINYHFFIEDKKLIIEIEKKENKKVLIDVNAHTISNYTEVFETDIVSKVEVLTDTETYYLYLLNERTTTTNKNDTNRAKGKSQTVYTANIEEANQKALDVIQANRYNHNITFCMLGELIKVGTPIAIKTKKSVVFDSYISAIKITQKKFIEYICGNIRTKFIEKILKERKK